MVRLGGPFLENRIPSLLHEAPRAAAPGGSNSGMGKLSLLPANIHGRPAPIGLQPPQYFLLDRCGWLTRLRRKTG